MGILVRKQSSTILTFDTIDELCNCINYNDIVWLKIIDITFTYNFIFPISLEQLFINNCNNCEIFLNKLPENIIFVEIIYCKMCYAKNLFNGYYNKLETLNLSYNRLTSIPMISGKLISLNLSNNDINKLPLINYFSEEIQYINLSYNKLDSLPKCILDLNNDCNLVLMPNYFWFNSYTNISLNRKIEDYHIEIAQRFFDLSLVNKLNRVRMTMNGDIERDVETTFIINPTVNFPNNNNQLNITTTIEKKNYIAIKTTAEQPQNVHNSDIQNSFGDSVIIIMNYSFPIISNYLNKIGYYYICDGFNIPMNFLFIKYIKTLCASTSIVSKVGVTFGEIMERIWAITENHANRIEIRKILRDEINSGKNMCFTGKVTRLVNTLSGFVDGIRIGYSENEQINNAVIATMRICENNSLLNVVDEVRKALNILEVPEFKQKIWLDALE